MEKTSTLSNGLIWFGASVSVAEIMTGTWLAPLGFAKGFLAIILGHIIGCLLFYFAGLIGAKTQKSSMETVKIAFGQHGSLVFSTLNIIQLIGWTAIMIGSGMLAAQTLFDLGSPNVWALIIGALIILWIFIGMKNFSKINIIAMSLLFLLTVFLSFIIFTGNGNYSGSGTISFGLAVELSAIMPLSWLPLISDYTRNAQKPILATKVSAIVYFFGSIWMYVIGLGIALYAAQSDVGQIMLHAGFGLAGLLIIIFSTVTSAFLDAYSAGVSSISIHKKLNEKTIAVIVSIIGILLAIFTETTKFEGFLLFIGSVFAPMIAVLITNYFILKKNFFEEKFSQINIIVWLVGFILYRYLKELNPITGTTLPVIFISMFICYFAHKIFDKKK